MNLKRDLFYFLSVVPLILVIIATVTFFYNSAVHGEGVTDWTTSFQLAIILGIFLTWVNYSKRKRRKRIKKRNNSG